MYGGVEAERQQGGNEEKPNRKEEDGETKDKEDCMQQRGRRDV